MKKIIVVAALFASVTAFAADEKPFPRIEILQTELSNIQIDSRLGYGEIRGGQIVLDLSSKVLNLSLAPAFHCPGYMYCAQVMPAPIQFELPITRTGHDDCGANVYVARLDQRPVDGNLVQVTLIDHRSSQCKSLKPSPAIEGKIKVISSGRGSVSINSTSTFEGSMLVPFSRSETAESATIQ